MGRGGTSCSASPSRYAQHYRTSRSLCAISIAAPANGFLVLNDVWHPWWRASVDGRAARIVKANVLFRAVAVPPGRHIVRFTFHPFAGAAMEIAHKLRLVR